MHRRDRYELSDSVVHHPRCWSPQDFTGGLRIAATREKFTSRGNADKKIHAAVVAGVSAIFIPGATSTGAPLLIEGQQSDKLGHPLMNVPCSR